MSPRGSFVDAVVIVGAGLGGLRTAKGLRGEGFEGRIVLVGDEPHPPYDRPPLTKEVLAGTKQPQDCLLADASELADLGVELLLECGDVHLDLAARRLETAKGGFRFDRLVVATGARARGLPGGEGIGGVLPVRTITDAEALAALIGRVDRLCVIGAGLIGCEIASAACAAGLAVTLIEPANVPMLRAAGADFGEVIRALHECHGVDVRCGIGVTALRGSADRLEAIALTNGETLEADHVVLGVGVDPATDWLRGSALWVEDGVVCDSTLTASHPDVMAVGDVARFADPVSGSLRRFEQWTSTVEQARHVAGNLLLAHEDRGSFHGSNYFWSRQFGRMIQGVGTLEGEIELVSGSLQEQAFLALARNDGEVVGAFAIDRAKEFAEIRRDLAPAAES